MNSLSAILIIQAILSIWADIVYRSFIVSSRKGDNNMDKNIIEDISKSATEFTKSDYGKLQITLAPTQIVRDIAEVRMYGYKKYHSKGSWALVEMGRYVDALMRHLLAFIDNPDSVDEESGIPHYKHAACNMAFICEMMTKNWDERRAHAILSDIKLQACVDDYNKKTESNDKDGEE